LEQGSSDIGDRSHEDGRVVARWNEPPALPINFSLGIDRPDDDGTAANDLRAGYATSEGIGDKRRPNPATLMAAIDRQLSDQQAGNWIGRATSPDTARGSARIDSARRETVIADDLSLLVNYQDARKILTLV
jgi:hypothetical protein